MNEDKAIEIVAQAIKDRKAWGQSAGLRVAQWELVEALLALEQRLIGDNVPREELTIAHRQNNAMNAQLSKAQGDSARMRDQRDNARSDLKRLGAEFDALVKKTEKK